MPNLHVHYYHGNVKAFRQELDGTAPKPAAGGGGGAGSGSFSKSWTLGGVGGKADPNERDALGRTVLQLAASSLSHQAYTFFSILLRNQAVGVNLQDYESGYTALHRALFAGNIRAARDLLMRHDIDISIKDAEGLTAFDLYNGTVEGTNPSRDAQGTDLFVWGVNRNFTLGTGDSSDKAYPDRVNLLTQNQASEHPDPSQRFHHVGVNEVVMSKLHTGVVTSEPRGNLSLCGFGANGRLGRSIHSQLALLPLPDLPHTITSISLGQDHTLALTSGGYILSWGYNRFLQLGYAIDPPENPLPGRKDDDQIQVSPRRIVGPLKKEWVRGVAAGRMSSACWTADSVWTWGTNAGHLGYEKTANPVQILPRKVTAISQPVIDIALSDYAMICLLDSYEVVCFHHDTNFRITFSTPRILSDAFPFRPPQSTIKPMIEKVTSSGQTFAALSSIGDVFTFSLPNPAEDVSKDARDRHVTVKPQLIWALRKSFTAVKDVALGSDGTVIICTHSGHVFVRQRVKSGSGGLKFKRIPYLQRAIKVACNESGAFAAVVVNAQPAPIALIGRTLEEDLALLQPHYRRFDSQMTAADFDKPKHRVEDEDEEDEGINSISKDLETANKLCAILGRWRDDTADSLFAWSRPLLGSDLHLVIGGVEIPAHRTILALRIPVWKQLASDCRVGRISLESSTKLKLDVCHPLVGLLLLEYLYTDDVAAIWDARVARAVQTKYAGLKLPLGQVKSDLKAVSESLGLTPLSTVLESAGKSKMPKRTLPSNLRTFFDSTHAGQSAACDVVIRLADKEVACSSVILRARCPFFEAMFADNDWTTERIARGSIEIDMIHLKWTPMKLVLRYLHEGLEDDLFDYVHQETLDDFLDFVFEVLAAATELLLDRLILVCSRTIIRHCSVYNAAALACEASFYQATTLKLSIFDYIVACMETMLESGLLDEMHEDVLLELSQHITKQQLRKLSVSRSNKLVNAAMEKHRDWLNVQDFPVPRVRQPWKWKPRSPALSPVDLTTTRIRKKTPSPVTSPELRATPGQGALGDEMFTMDDDLASPLASGWSQTPKSSRPMTPLDLSAGGSSSRPVWKSKIVEAEKVDLRSVMAEAAASKPSRVVPGRTPPPDKRPGLPSAMSTPTKSPSLARSPPSAGGSSAPWRAVERAKSSFTSVQAQQSPPVRPSLPQGTSSRSSTVITPVKLQPAPGVQRKSSGAAWTAATSFAPPAPVLSTSPDSRSFSLLAIQQEEQDYAKLSKKPQLRSFAEIQAEEREKEKSRTEEEEFMRWWEEERARVAGEGSAGGSGSGANGGGGNRGRGKARGRGGGGTGQGQSQRKVPAQAKGRGRGGGPAGSVVPAPPTPAAPVVANGGDKGSVPAQPNGHSGLQASAPEFRMGAPFNGIGTRGGRGRGGGPNIGRGGHTTARQERPS